MALGWCFVGDDGSVHDDFLPVGGLVEWIVLAWSLVAMRQMQHQIKHANNAEFGENGFGFFGDFFKILASHGVFIDLGADVFWVEIFVRRKFGFCALLCDQDLIFGRTKWIFL